MGVNDVSSLYLGRFVIIHIYIDCVGAFNLQLVFAGPILGRQFLHEQRKFLLKKAHFSKDDTRIFDCKDGTVRAVSSHLGKNPYEVGAQSHATGEVTLR